MAANINVVVLEGNLTKDPELKVVGDGISLGKLRLAVNERTKEGGDWHDRVNYFDVTVWGKQAEMVNEHLAKGSGLIVDGRLRWREWEAEGGGKRQAVEVVADNIRFTGGPKQKVPTSDVPVDTSDIDPAPQPVGSGGRDEGIPF